MEQQDFCETIATIPQFGGTCWFNAILMATLYSQKSRKLLLKVYKDWDEDNKFLMIMKELLLYNYVFTEKVQHFLNKFKPEVIILYMIHYFQNDVLRKHFKSIIKNSAYNDFAGNSQFINKMYKYLGVKCLDICYDEKSNKFLFNINRKIKYENHENNLMYSHNYNSKEIDFERDKQENQKILDEKPDVIIFTHSKLSNKYLDHLKIDVLKQLNDKTKNAYQDIFNLSKYPNANMDKYNLDDLKNYQDTIKFNGSDYKLDSCLLNNYNDTNDITHLIAGITCKEKRYVYNGWDKNLSIAKMKEIKTLNKACKLLRFDWDLHKTSGDDSFCFNTAECTKIILNEKEKLFKNDDLCFSFNKFYNGGTVLIYIRDDKTKNEDLSSFDVNKTRSEKTLSLTSSPNFKRIVKKMHKIKTLTKSELINQIISFNELLEKDKLTSKSISELQDILYKEVSEYFAIDLEKSISKDDFNDEDAMFMSSSSSALLPKPKLGKRTTSKITQDEKIIKSAKIVRGGKNMKKY